MNVELLNTILHEQGMFYAGSSKKYLGKIVLDQDKKGPIHPANTFGYYLRPDGVWIVFITDAERGIELVAYTCDSEEKALDKIFEIAEAQYYNGIIEKIAKNLDSKKPIIISYLMQKYNFSQDKAEKAVNYLAQSKYLTAEFVYFIQYHAFYPEKYAIEVAGYTAEKLSKQGNLTLLGAFNYMVYLKKKPEEALANLKKGLPRRKLFSPQDVENLKKYMD